MTAPSLWRVLADPSQRARMCPGADYPVPLHLTGAYAQAAGTMTLIGGFPCVPRVTTVVIAAPRPPLWRRLPSAPPRSPSEHCGGRARADEQPRADPRVGQAVPSQPRDLRLLRGQLDADFHRALAGGLPGGLHLAAGPLSERIHTHRVQHVVGGTQLLAPRRDGARGAATPRRAGERGQLGAERGPAHPFDRLSVPALGRVAVAEQGADGAPIASTHSVGVTRVRSDSNSSAAHSSATSPVLDAASASSGTIWDPYPSVRLEGPSRRVAGGGVLPEAVVQERARVGREADQPDHTACNRLPRYGLDQFRRLPLLAPPDPEHHRGIRDRRVPGRSAVR